MIFKYAKGMFQAPDRLEATIQIGLGAFSTTAELVALDRDHYLRGDLLTANRWINAELIPGFSPASLMARPGGAAYALLSITDLEMVGEKDMDGLDVFHLRGTVEADAVHALTFGLIRSRQGTLKVDVYIEVSERRVALIKLHEPPPADETDSEETTWWINILDYNQEVSITPPPMDENELIMTHLSRRITSPWLVLAVVSLPVFIGALDLTIISAVLPDVIVSLDLPVKEYLDQASWAVNGYLLAYAISMTFTGRLSDLIGRRAIYIACLVIFIIGSYLVTAYDSELLNSWVARFYRQILGQHPPRLAERHLYLVIIGRVIQAFGAGAMVPVTIALAGDLFPPERRARPLGVIGAVDTMGWVLGHLYGGVMVRFFGEHGNQIADAC